MSNAQKFSPDGSSITVEVRESEAEVQWEVVDEGPGISTEDQAHLFERFFVGTGNQGETATRVGLGLPTALAIAQAHGGGVEVMSEIGCGSRFILHVPTEPILDDEDA